MQIQYEYDLVSVDTKLSRCQDKKMIIINQVTGSVNACVLAYLVYLVQVLT